ncbi:MAG TPA: ribonuclease HIII, partial [Dielma fastidiosa]|nr:ribonuclease HIII [Dielma fastidiosa]
MNTVSLTLNQKQIDTLFETYRSKAVKPPAYAQYQLKLDGCTITAYDSKKVVFQGRDAEEMAALFEPKTLSQPPLQHAAELNGYPQAGS